MLAIVGSFFGAGKASGVDTIKRITAKFEQMSKELTEAGDAVNQQIEDNFELMTAKQRELEEYLQAKREENKSLAQVAHTGFAIAKGIEDFIGFGKDPQPEQSK